MKKYILIFVLLFSINTFAGINKSLKKSGSAIADFYSKEESKKARDNSFISINLILSPTKLPFPLSWGGEIYYTMNSKWMFGVDFMKSGMSFDLFSFKIAELDEYNFSLIARRFFGNSFNVKFGIGHRNLKLKFPKNLYELVNQEDYSDVLTELTAKYIKLGIGSQFQFKKHYTLAIDWFTINIPVMSDIVHSSSDKAKDDDAKESIKKYEKTLSYYPSGSIFQFNIGLLF